MEQLGSFADARTKVLADVEALLARIRGVVQSPAQTVDKGVEVLRRLQGKMYEDLNQIQHEFMILRAAEWLLDQNVCTADTVWSWSRNGGANEPDLRAERNGLVLLSAEITTSREPKGMIDRRMGRALEKLSRMAGRRYYFAATPSMCQRADTKIRRAGWQIQAVHLPEALIVRGTGE